MGRNDTAEQLDACKADAIRYEQEIAELQRRLTIAEQGWHPAALSPTDTALAARACRIAAETARALYSRGGIGYNTATTDYTRFDALANRLEATA